MNPLELEAPSSILEASHQFKKIAEGRGTLAQKQVVAVNAAYAENIIEPGKIIKDSIAQNLEILSSDKISKIIIKLANITGSHSC